MNKLILSFTICLLISPSSFSQSLVQEGVIWHESYSDFTGREFFSSIRLQGDTLIEGLEYKRIQKTSNAFPLPEHWQNTGDHIREDNGRVFLLTQWQEEALLYDFNLQPGDTIQVMSGCKLLTQHIDSITLDNGEQQTRWTFVNPDFPMYEEYQWILGIGGTTGLYGPTNYCYTDISNILRCYSKQGETIYTRSPGISCTNPVNTTSLIDTVVLRLFPNPVKDELWIEIQSSEQLTQVKLFEPGGKLLLSSNAAQLNLSALESGLYYIRIQLEGGNQLVRKIVKK